MTIAMPPSYDLGNGYSLQKADKNLFAVFQSIYSNADTEMWYDWNLRLNDTLWSDDCYFLTLDGHKLGGAILHPGGFAYPFLVHPFCDRRLFYRLLHRAALALRNPANEEIKTNGVLDEDVEALLTLGYARTNRSRRVMVRPTEPVAAEAPAGFVRAVPGLEQAGEIALMLHTAFENTLDAEILGPMPEADVRAALERYAATGTSDVSSLVYHAQTGALAGACVAGLDPNAPNGFAGVWVVAVLPGYQNCGLGAYMLKTALNNAYPHSKVMKLVVTSGSPAECLYHRLGFFPGPRFTNMRFRI